MNAKLVPIVLALSVLSGVACSSSGKIAQSEGAAVNEAEALPLAEDMHEADVALEGVDAEAMREPWALGYFEDGRRREWKDLVIVVDERSRGLDRFEPAGTWGVIDTEGGVLLPKERGFGMPFQAAGDGQIFVRVGVGGLATFSGEQRIEPIYSELVFLTSERLDAAGGPYVKVKTKSGEFGLMNVAGEWLIAPEYSSLEISADGPYVKVEVEAVGMGIKNLKDEWVIPLKEDWWADEDDIDWRFEVYDSPEFEAVGGPFVVVKMCEKLDVWEGDGYVWLCEQQKGDEYFSYDRLDPCHIYAVRTGERVHAKDLTKCDGVSAGIFPVREAGSGLEGYMNLKGEMVIPAVFDTALPFVNGRARVRLSLNYAKSLCKKSGARAQAESQSIHDKNIITSCAGGFRNWEKAAKYCRRGDVRRHLWSRVTERCPCEWSSLKDWSLLYMCDEKGTYVNYGWAYIDEQGQLLTRFDYEKLGEFFEGAALVRRDERYGYIDETGYEIIPPLFSSAGGFDDGKARVFYTRRVEDKDKDEDEDEPSYFCYAEYSIGLEESREQLQRHEKALAKLGYADGWQAISQAWKNEADGRLSLNGYCLVRDETSSFGVLGACESSKGVKPEGRHWIRDEDAKGYGLMENGQWLTPYRLEYPPKMTDRGLSIFRIYRGRVGRWESSWEHYDVVWINAAGKIIWPLAWNDPCQDTDGKVKWPEGACKRE